MPKTWRSCLSFSSQFTLSSRLRSVITPKFQSEHPEEEREYALLSDPESDFDSNSNHVVTCTHIEDLDGQYTNIQDNPAVRLAGEYPRPRTPPKAKTKTKTTTKAGVEVEVKERFLRFGIGGAGNVQRLVILFWITRACIAFACAAVRFGIVLTGFELMDQGPRARRTVSSGYFVNITVPGTVIITTIILYAASMALSRDLSWMLGSAERRKQQWLALSFKMN